MCAAEFFMHLGRPFLVGVELTANENKRGIVAIPKFVKVTGPVIWIDQSWSGGWEVDPETGAWWEKCLN